MSFKEKRRLEQDASSSKGLLPEDKIIEKDDHSEKPDGNLRKLFNMFVSKKNESKLSEPAKLNQKHGTLKNAADFNMDSLKNSEKLSQISLERSQASIVRNLVFMNIR